MSFPCNHFETNSCRFGTRCVKQHGDEDQRVVCVYCHVNRCPPSKQYCAPCFRFLVSNVNWCSHFMQGDCQFGEKCAMQHGRDDKRATCIDCGVNRVRPGKPRCTACHKAKVDPNMCKHFPNCRSGDRCMWTHGVDDPRPWCSTCESVRIPARFKLCRDCYAAQEYTCVTVGCSGIAKGTCKYCVECSKEHTFYLVPHCDECGERKQFCTCANE